MESVTTPKRHSPEQVGGQEDDASVAVAVEEATESELSALPIPRLLQFLSNKSILHPSANAKKHKAKEKLLKVLQNLLSSNPLHFQNSDLFSFHRIIFKARQDPAVTTLLRNIQLQIGQRVKIRGIGELNKKELMKILKLLLTNETLLSGAEREEYLHGVLQKFFQNSTIFEELTNDELFWLWEKRLIDTFTFLDDSTSALVPQKISAIQKVVSQLYQRRASLNSRQLLKLFAYSAPALNSESQAIIDELYKQEVSQQKSFCPIALSTPSSFPQNKATTGLDDKSGFVENKTTVQYFKSAVNETWILDTSFDLSFSKSILDPNHVDRYNKSINFGSFAVGQKAATYPYSIHILSPLKPTKVIVLYCSFPPLYDVSSTFLIGILSPASPILPINPLSFLPASLISSDAVNVRLGCKVVEQTNLRKYVGPDIVSNPVHELMNRLDVNNNNNNNLSPSPARQGGLLQGEALIDSPFKAHRSTSGEEVIVCNGETHSFKLSEEVGFDELLKRCMKRWNLDGNESNWELQNENYETLSGNESVLKSIREGRVKSIKVSKRLRLIPLAGGGGHAQPPMNFQPQQPQPGGWQPNPRLFPNLN